MQNDKLFSVSDCHHCEVREQSPFCGMLTKKEIDFFMKIKKEHCYEKDQALFYEGNSCEWLYLLCSGSVKLVQSSRTGHQQILEIVSPGDWIDKGSFFSSGRHSATAQALQHSEVCLLSGADINEILPSLPGLALSLISALSRQVEKGWERSCHLVSKSAIERLARVLLDLGRRHGIRKGECIIVSLSLKREELAELVGVTQETVVRLLATLKKEGVISLSGRKITIIDEGKLNRLQS